MWDSNASTSLFLPCFLLLVEHRYISFCNIFWKLGVFSSTLRWPEFCQWHCTEVFGHSCINSNVRFVFIGQTFIEHLCMTTTQTRTPMTWGRGPASLKVSLEAGGCAPGEGPFRVQSHWIPLHGGALAQWACPVASHPSGPILTSHNT